MGGGGGMGCKSFEVRSDGLLVLNRGKQMHMHTIAESSIFTFICTSDIVDDSLILSSLAA